MLSFPVTQNSLPLSWGHEVTMGHSGIGRDLMPAASVSPQGLIPGLSAHEDPSGRCFLGMAPAWGSAWDREPWCSSALITSHPYFSQAWAVLTSPPPGRQEQPVICFG